MGFFDFLRSTTRYRDKPDGIGRLERRRKFIVEPYVDDFRDARVLDLASHDGRWSYAIAAVGAREVVGIEARQELIDQFAEYPDDAIKAKVSFIQGDVFEVLPRLIEADEKFDVVSIYGLYYHIMDHYLLLKLVHQLGPRLILIDSLFTTHKQPLIKLGFENTGKFLNTIAHTEGQLRAPKGIPSRPAMDMMAGSLGYAVEWADWSTLPPDQRQGLPEYFRDPSESAMLRGTCALRPS